MKRLLFLLIALMVVMSGQAVSAHGPDEHEGRQTAQVTAAAEAAATPVSPESIRPARDAGDDAQDGSILSNIHPATVHFPIALLLMAALTELAVMVRPSPALQGTARIMLWDGAVGAVVTAMFGWFHTGIWFGGSGTMQWHRWIGTSIAIVAPLAAFLAGRGHIAISRLLLFGCAALILAQGYLGPELAHGPNHLGF
ncbi:hypothetical protein HME9302_00247 [Alteripontixanthobacter maritimus]|uniref:DUF2231 domain-containing protein n=1 Tax=Alteripontixanthobacter maritimus TaxID=2161824 RepID=A0A369Q819_9SPHN|nr:DUF2231 domain-containing protein [Alteripontixanthobacter maritimus]RDC59069.1 hypothetical protein HME9302_00247 [Alteripontixanthobacter maritimus]